MSILLAALAAVLVGTILQRVSGTGVGLVVAPVLSLLMGPGAGVLATNAATTCSGFLITLSVRRLVEWRHAAVLVTSEDFAKKHGLKILARIKAVGVSGIEPSTMGLGPISASQKALARAGVSVADLDVVEINEAFASQAIACIRDLGLKDETINLDGGAIAIGHPLGATGARIVGKAAALLEREGGRYALATQCIGGGQGIATVLERA